MKRIDHLLAGLGLLLVLISFILDRLFHLELGYYTYLYSAAVILFLASYYLGRKRR